MEGREVLEQALKLKPQERFLVIEGLLRSLDEPDEKLDAIWAEEAEKRLRAYRDGRLKGIPMEEIFELPQNHFPHLKPFLRSAC
ncbi:MAG: addiction module protein [Syntrophobacteraceae bacterium]|nr:addiction module protein [Syntrophobacteraceae bacterium]